MRLNARQNINGTQRKPPKNRCRSVVFSPAIEKHVVLPRWTAGWHDVATIVLVKSETAEATVRPSQIDTHTQELDSSILKAQCVFSTSIRRNAKRANVEKRSAAVAAVAAAQTEPTAARRFLLLRCICRPASDSF